MTEIEQSTQEASFEDQYEEKWVVVINTGGEYTLSKNQARLLMSSMQAGKREVIFQTFMIAIPYIAEFYRTARYKKGLHELPAQAQEKEYKPTKEEKEKIEKIKKEIKERLKTF